MDERFKLIKPYIENKVVLDIGCCGSCCRMDVKVPQELEGRLHNNIKKYAKSVLGIDMEKECIEFLKSNGYNVELANAEKFNLNQKFDVIVAGELIEHLSNFQGFFDSVKRHLRDDGILILTTPSMFYFKEILFLMIRGRPPVHRQHICYFEEITLSQLLDRFDFSIEKIMYTTERYPREKKPVLKDLFVDFILRLIEKLIPFKQIKYNKIIVIGKNEKV